MSDKRVTAFCAAAIGLLVTHAFAAGIYQCTDATGKKLTSDRPIAACFDREQRELRPDGSVKRLVPPTMTSEERNELELRDRAESAKRVGVKDAVRRDRLLATRFPNEAAHSKARETAVQCADLLAALTCYFAAFVLGAVFAALGGSYGARYANQHRSNTEAVTA